MKIRHSYRTLIPLLLAFINVNAGDAYLLNTWVPDLDPRNYDCLQEDQNTTAHLHEVISTGGPVQVFAENDLLPGKNLISGKGISNRCSSANIKLTFISLQDKKELLKTFIFPFHFFW